MISKDGLSWNQELASPKRFEPFGYAQGSSAKRLNLRWDSGQALWTLRRDSGLADWMADCRFWLSQTGQIQ